MVAISPQLPERNAEVVAQHKLTFPALSDAGNDWSRGLGETHALPADLREIYLGFGIDLEAANGDASWELPLPLRIVVDAKGVIRALYADPDYTRRPEVEQTLEVLRGLN